MVALEGGSGLTKVATEAAALFFLSSAVEDTVQSVVPDADTVSRRTTAAESPAAGGPQQAAFFGAGSVAFFGVVAIVTGSQSHRIHRNGCRNLLTYSKHSISFTPPPPPPPPTIPDTNSGEYNRSSELKVKARASLQLRSTMPRHLSVCNVPFPVNAERERERGYGWSDLYRGTRDGGCKSEISVSFSKTFGFNFPF